MVKVVSSVSADMAAVSEAVSTAAACTTHNLSNCAHERNKPSHSQTQQRHNYLTDEMHGRGENVDVLFGQSVYASVLLRTWRCKLRAACGMHEFPKLGLGRTQYKTY